MSDLPASMHIMEVGPRDGLQIEPRILSADEKIRLIETLVDTGIKEIEVGSFVNPKAVPQMAGSDEIASRVTRRDGVLYRALWLNKRGLDQAIANGRIDIDGRLTLTASETFIRRNTNRSIEDTFAEMPDWIATYRQAGVEVNALGLMAAFGCNFEGVIPQAKVISLIARVEQVMKDHGCRFEYITIADTMGWANPLQVKRLVGEVRSKWPELTIKLHLHDTRGAAIANAVAAMELGVREFDSSVGGLGGCPFAGNQGAAGNICTEDLVFICEEMGIATDIDLDALIEAAKLAQSLVGRPLPSKVLNGGSLTRFKAAAA